MLVTEVQTQAVTFPPISTFCSTESLSNSCHTANKSAKGCKMLIFHTGPLFFRAMSSPTNKEQFLKQFDNIVRGIVDNKERVGKLSMFCRGFCFPALDTGSMFSRAQRSVSSANCDWITLPPWPCSLFIVTGSS